MGNGANRLFNIMKESSGNVNTDTLVTLTVKSLNPLTFKLDEKLTITDDFYQLEIPNGTFTLSQQVKALVLNSGQLYYILNADIELGKVSTRLTTAETDITNKANKTWTLLASPYNSTSASKTTSVNITDLSTYKEFLLLVTSEYYLQGILASTLIPYTLPENTSGSERRYFFATSGSYEVKASRGTGLYKARVTFELTPYTYAKLYGR